MSDQVKAVQNCPAGLGTGIGLGPTLARNRKKTYPKHIFNSHHNSIINFINKLVNTL